MLTSTEVSSHTDGSGSGVSDGSGAEVLGAGLDAGADVLGLADGVADSDVEVLGEADGEADSETDADGLADSDTEALGVGVVANAAGADSSASGAMTAVVAAAAMTRRIFMKTSESPVRRYAAARDLGGQRVAVAGMAVDSASETCDACEGLSWNSHNFYVR
ncbi:hypothetical protein ACFYXC_11190 [Streptomyces sp. NPDC002701]|uniref:hypothetical protein n=1 Tax=Streptomyces sp. NPDC002701 TaxID=3364661 RepID=UPI00368CC02D